MPDKLIKVQITFYHTLFCSFNKCLRSLKKKSMNINDESYFWAQSADLMALSIKNYLDIEFSEQDIDFRFKQFFSLVELPVLKLIELLNQKAPNEWASHQIQFVRYHEAHPEEGDYLRHLEGMKKALIEKYKVDYDNFKNGTTTITKKKLFL